MQLTKPTSLHLATITPFIPLRDKHSLPQQSSITHSRNVCLRSAIMEDSLVESSLMEQDDVVIAPLHLRVQMMKERQLRAKGLFVGVSFIALSSIIGCLFGFFNPLILGIVVVLSTAISFAMVESCNESQNPLPSSSFQVAESTIPNAGMGLFAGTNIAKSTYLFDYEGEILTEDEYFDKYPNGDGRYVAQVNTGIWSLLGIAEPLYIDAMDPKLSNLARFMNSSGNNANVYWKKQAFGTQAGIMHFYTIRDIQKGEELLFDYGDNYWEAADQIDYSSSSNPRTLEER